MWADTLSDPAERQAFHSLLAEYFQRPCPTSPPATAHSTAAANPDLPAPRTVAPVPTPSYAASRPQSAARAPPRERPTGPRKPAGLESQQSPLNKSELEKQKALSPLYVAAATHAVKSYTPPPPKRTGIEPGGSGSAGGGGGGGPPPPPPAPQARQAPGTSRTVTAAYDYEGSSIDDLPIAEGEQLTVVETVSSDWLKCRNSVGSEGLVPASYVR
ncbi:hypothetical protein JCM3774_000097 [Rhodotorula dairenensis]